MFFLVFSHDISLPHNEKQLLTENSMFSLFESNSKLEINNVQESN